MKKNLLLLLVSLYCFNGVAQNKSKEEATELMAEDTCECIAKKKISKSDKKEDKEMALGLCLLESFNEHKSKSKYYRKKTLNDIEQIGEDVGFVMASMCAEDFLSIFSSEELVEIVNDEYDVGLDGSGNAEGLTIEVELISMNNDVISYINVKDDYDKSHTFLITEEFEGYDLLKRSNYGKSFTVTFKQVELFDLSEKQYVTKKVITKLEAL
ncbi:hypothetical protein [Winogradskyella sp.]|uniref:hypothetical protein n=1 Tax=Winogradskyella sp. TaxID=1883156 RepID=UPI003BAA3957